MNESLRGKPRSVGLDLLRCFLCAGVIFHHYRPEEPGVGAFMVVGFFVLSGYLLGLSLCNRESLDVRLFYRRKSLRLLPMLIVSLALGFGFYLAHCLSTGDYSDLVAENKNGYFCWTELISHYNPPSWFVFAECYFLILLPFVFFFDENSLRPTRLDRMRGCTCLCASCTGARYGVHGGRTVQVACCKTLAVLRRYACSADDERVAGPRSFALQNSTVGLFICCPCCGNSYSG